MASNPQASERGMASTRATGFDVMTTGATGVLPVGWISSGCVLVMLMAGAATGAGRGKTLMRAVSFFGPRLTDGAPITLSSRAGGTGRIAAPGSVSIPGGFGNGCNTNEAAGVSGGRPGQRPGASPGRFEEGKGGIFAGNRGALGTGGGGGETIGA